MPDTHRLPQREQLQRYRTWLFDCDGVLLDSNRVKTEGFHTVALQYGSGPAEALVDYHVANGGVSRFRKFTYLLESILQRPADAVEVERLSSEYGQVVEQGLLDCRVAEGLQALRELTRDARWGVVSGGAQAQLRSVFAQRELHSLFDLGTYGSPDTKDEIFARLLESGELRQPAVFIGDSRYDVDASLRAGLECVFVSDWSEFHGWQAYCEERGVGSVPNLGVLASCLS